MAQSVEVNFELKYKEALKGLDDLTKKYEELQKEVQSANKKTEESLKDVEKTAENSAKGVKKVGLTLKNIAGAAVVLTVLQKGFEFVQEAIGRNQEVLDGLRVGFETAQIVFNQVFGALIDIGKSVASSSDNFDALGKVMKGVLNIAVTPFKLAFNGIKATIVGAQLAWEKSFFGGNDPGRIKELQAELETIKEETIEIGVSAVKSGVDIVTNIGEAVSEVSDIGKTVVKELGEVSVKTAFETAQTNVQLKKSADIARVANQGLIEEYDRQAEQQRQLRDDDRLSIAERQEANNKLLEILTEQKEVMMENADAVLANAQAQYELTGADEDYIAVLEAQNEKKAIAAQIEGQLSEQKSNLVALEKESDALQLSRDEATALRQQAQRDFNVEMEQNEVKRLQMTLDNLQTEREEEEKRLTEKRNTFKEGTQAYIDANNELLDYQQANANEQKKIEKGLSEAKVAQVQGALGNIASIVGENSKFGKAIAVTQAIIDTYVGANKALAQGGLFGFIGAAAVIASGIANVKTITSKKPPPAPSFAKGGSGRGASAPSTPSAPPPPVLPDINTVGASGINQLADAIGGQSQQPVQAFVVSNDVTTAQGLERNIIDGASI
jgi:DNA repair exonuclease SbcCD ATPase subunit